jgi:hypothetical protein
MSTTTSKSLAAVLVLTAVLTTPLFAAGHDDPKHDFGDRGGNVITRLIHRIVHLFDTPGAIFPVPPQP